MAIKSPPKPEIFPQYTTFFAGKKGCAVGKSSFFGRRIFAFDILFETGMIVGCRISEKYKMISDKTELMFAKKTGAGGGKSAEFLYEKEKIMLAFYVNNFYTKTKWGKVERIPLNLE